DDQLFGSGSGVQTVGKGKVYAGQDAETALKALNVAPDFDYAKPSNGQQVLFAHRKLADGDLYFVDNRGDSESTFDATFRVTGKAPELWYSETGRTAPASFSSSSGRTTVPLHLQPWGTVFVVFRKPASETSHTVPKPALTHLAT